MPPTRRKGIMREEARTSISAGTQTSDYPMEAQTPSKETIVTAPSIDTTPTTSPTFQVPGKTLSRKVLRLKCPTCNDYPDGFRSEHEGKLKMLIADWIRANPYTVSDAVGCLIL
jgi:hypothetical protein